MSNRLHPIIGQTREKKKKEIKSKKKTSQKSVAILNSMETYSFNFYTATGKYVYKMFKV
jgi:hypothetical protein